MYCRNCGAQIPEGNKFCENCGAPAPDTKAGTGPALHRGMSRRRIIIIAVIAAFLYNKARSNRAYSDPALMEKRYQGVLNPHMEATLILGIGSVRHVDIPGRR